MLAIDELEELLDKIRIRVLEANRRGELNELLALMQMEDLTQGQKVTESSKSGRIVIIGASEVANTVLKKTVEKCGISRDRLELYTDYERIKTYNFRKLQYNYLYSAVLLGPMPHSTVGKGDFSSTIAALESEDGYPPVVRLTNGNQMKITKSGLENKILELIADGYIVA